MAAYAQEGETSGGETTLIRHGEVARRQMLTAKEGLLRVTRYIVRSFLCVR